MAMQIYSKLERALGSIHIPRLPYASLRLQPFSLGRHSFPPSLPFRGRRPRLPGRSAHRKTAGEKRPIMRQKIRAFDDSFRFYRVKIPKTRDKESREASLWNIKGRKDARGEKCKTTTRATPRVSTRPRLLSYDVRRGIVVRGDLRKMRQERKVPATRRLPAGSEFLTEEIFPSAPD